MSGTEVPRYRGYSGEDLCRQAEAPTEPWARISKIPHSELGTSKNYSNLRKIEIIKEESPKSQGFPDKMLKSIQ